MAIERRMMEMMQRDVDGQLSEAEHTILRERLATDREANAVHEGLRRLSHRLSEAAKREVPPSLKASIIRAISEREMPAHAKPAAFSMRHALASIVSSWNPAWAFAGGAVAGIAVVAVILFSVVSPIALESEVAGTMVRTPAAESFVPVAHTEFDADGVRGSTISLRSGAFRMVTVRIEAEGTVVSTIAFPKNHVQLTGIRTLEGRSADIENNEIGVSVTSAGNTMIELLFLTSDEHVTTVPLAISRGGHEICRTDIHLEASGG